MAYNQAGADVGVGGAGSGGLAASMNDALQQAKAQFFMEADQRSAFASGSSMAFSCTPQACIISS